MIADLGSLMTLRRESSRAINAENPTGEPGRGGIAASELGPSRKGSPCLRNIPSGETVTLADIDGPGCNPSYLDHRRRKDHGRRLFRAA